MPRPQVPVGLSPQFGADAHGRTLILDGDFGAYACAATVKTLETGIRRFQQWVLEAAFMARCADVSVHLTASGSYKVGRHLVHAVKPYQGNRVGKQKPPLLEDLRTAMADEANWLPEFHVQLHYDIEADDAMMIEAHMRQEQGIIRSGDKDLRLTPYPWYDEAKGTVEAGAGFGWVEAAYTPSGALKGSGRGRMFFWLQMLMGDPADNVQGLLKLHGKRVGPRGALDYLLAQPTHEGTVANAVIDAYREINQNPLPEAVCLWLLRHPWETATHYLSKLPWSKANAQFLEDCFERDWYDKAAEDEPT